MAAVKQNNKEDMIIKGEHRPKNALPTTFKLLNTRRDGPGCSHPNI